MGMGAQHPHRGQPCGGQRLFQRRPLFQQAGVQQDTAAVIQFLQRNQLIGLDTPSVSLDLCQVHKVPPRNHVQGAQAQRCS